MGVLVALVVLVACGDTTGPAESAYIVITNLSPATVEVHAGDCDGIAHEVAILETSGHHVEPVTAGCWTVYAWRVADGLSTHLAEIRTHVRAGEGLRVIF